MDERCYASDHKELLKITSLLLKFVDQTGCEIVAFSPEDVYYERIWHQDRDFGGNPPIAMGSLDDDMESLKKILSGEYAPFTGDLGRLGAVLTTVGSMLSLPDGPQKQ